MKRKLLIPILVLGLTVAVLHWGGIGYYSSGSAVADLKAELESIYGYEYTGKSTENGTESMEFQIIPKSRFLTNWNLRNTLRLDYKYECRVIFTTHMSGNTSAIRTITYQGTDPMGAENTFVRAHLDLDTRTESTEIH